MKWAEGDRWERARSLFGQALDRSEAERDAWLEREADGDSALLQEVRSLLARVEQSLATRVEDSSSPRLAPHPGPGSVPGGGPRGLPERIGPYEVLSVLGEGGMGWVLEARQQNPSRRVALKVVKAGFTSADMRRRFELESQVLGRLHHPAIAQVYEAGTAEVGTGVEVPYFAMELVQGGRSITRYVYEEGVDLDQRLSLFAEVVDGIEHGHQRGVIHRDLKPGNLLVDEHGRPKIIDFGLARAVTDDDDLVSMHTRTGQVMGTPAFMSPEQFLGDPEAVTALSDVYSLGVVLYLMLAGAMPYDTKGKSLVEMAATVRNQSAPRLSGSSHGSSSGLRVRADLDTIVAKAMEKDPARRYASAGALAADLRRFLRGEPIQARPASAMYQLRMFTRRNKALVAGVLAVLLVSVIGAVVALDYAFEAEEQAATSDRQNYHLRITAAARLVEQGELAEARAALAAIPAHHQGWERRHLEARVRPETAILAPASQKEELLRGLALSPDGRWIALRYRHGSFRVLDATTHEVVFETTQHHGGFFHVVFCDDGSRLVVVGRHPNEGMNVWVHAIPGGELLHEEHLGPAKSHAFGHPGIGPGRAWLAWVTSTHLQVRDPTRPDLPVLASAVLAPKDAARPQIRNDGPLTVLPDGERIVVQATGGTQDLLILARDDLSLRGRVPFDAQAGKLLPSADGRWLFVIGQKDGLHRLDLRPPHGVLSFDPLSERKQPVNVVTRPDGRLVTGSKDGTLALWDPSDGTRLASLAAHDESSFGAASVLHSLVLPDGGLLTGGADGRLRWFDRDVFQTTGVLTGHQSYVYSVAFLDGERRLVSGGWDGFVTIEAGERADGSLRWWDTASGEPVGTWRAENHRVLQVLPLPDRGELLVHAARQEREHEVSQALVLVLSQDTGRVLRRIADGPGSLAIDPRGALLVGVMNGVNRPGLGRIDGSSPPIVRLGVRGQAAAFLPGGEAVMVVGAAGLTRLQRDTWEATWVYEHPEGEPARALDVFQDGRVAVAWKGGTISVHDPSDGRRLLGPVDLGDDLHTIRFTPDGERLLGGGNEGLLHVIDARHGELITSLAGHGDYLHDLALSADGETVVSASGDHTLRIWSPATHPELLEARRAHRALVAELEPRVLALLDGEGLTVEQAVVLLRAADDLDDRRREVALQVLLRESLDRDPDPLGEALDG
jgi:serine/threonine protein kinase/WD40 repeat protein